MQIHTLVTQPKKRKKRVGRGGKRGTYSGRGTKGQKARAGRRIRPQLRDILKKIPKKRGYRFRSFRTRPQIVSLILLERYFTAGDTVSPQTLAEKGVLTGGGNNLSVKILGQGKITKKLIVEKCETSTSAREKIEKAGGTVRMK